MAIAIPYSSGFNRSALDSPFLYVPHDAVVPGALLAGDLEPIEKASRSKLRELQLSRLKWSLKRAYEKVPHYRKKFDAAGLKVVGGGNIDMEKLATILHGEIP